jgi:hypothetical protein
MEDKTFHQKVAEIQQKLKAPKGQYNSFGKYKYRSCEDILEAVKPLLGDLVLIINDEIIEVSGRVYVKAVANITDGTNSSVTVSAYAREPEEKKGMDSSQITGTASSYARKYALNGLFLIDDTKDADSMDNTQSGETLNNGKSLDGKSTEKQSKILWALLYKKYPKDGTERVPQAAIDFANACKNGTLQFEQVQKEINRLTAEVGK